MTIEATIAVYWMGRTGGAVDLAWLGCYLANGSCDLGECGRKLG